MRGHAHHGSVTLDLTSVDLITEVVRTERLLLRPFRREDVDPVYRACTDPDVQRWLTALPSPYTRETAAEFVLDIAPRGRAAGTDLGCAIETDGELVGACGMHQLTTGRMGPEIGYWIAPWARRQGYATEAAGGLAEWAFGLGAFRVHLFADVNNAPSQAVARRAGFEQEGVVRQCLEYRDGSRQDAVLFARLAGE
jgi:RimJ/RimL family protein N-acetyltransferase